VLAPLALNSWKDAVTFEPVEEGFAISKLPGMPFGFIHGHCSRHENDQQIGGKLARAPGNVPPANRFGAKISTVMIARTGASSFPAARLLHRLLVGSKRQKSLMPCRSSQFEFLF
jgi:hypothetical protein